MRPHRHWSISPFLTRQVSLVLPLGAPRSVPHNHRQRMPTGTVMRIIEVAGDKIAAIASHARREIRIPRHSPTELQLMRAALRSGHRYIVGYMVYLTRTALLPRRHSPCRARCSDLRSNARALSYSPRSAQSECLIPQQMRMGYDKRTQSDKASALLSTRRENKQRELN